jgi:glycosyltransferase involved in cell wall biosynthesis
MFCSTIIPTVGRASLERAVSSVLSQDFPAAESEVIVVNDSGQALEQAEWMASPRVQVATTRRRERSVARNTGAALARGGYLHFLDDDDWLLPGALAAFQDLALRSPQAAWLYGVSRLVDRQGGELIELHHGLNGNCFIQVMSGEWVPLQSSLVKAEAFFKLGGFNPAITGPEDVDLCRRVALTGELAGTEAPAACIGMGSQGSTTDYQRSPSFSRLAREQILENPGVFRRMFTSAGLAAAPGWYGRMARVYLTSAAWNLRRGRGLHALSRTGFCLTAMLLAGVRLFSPRYWAALFTHYDSPTFRRPRKTSAKPNAAFRGSV